MSYYRTTNYEDFLTLIADKMGKRPHVHHGTDAVHRNKVRMIVEKDGIVLDCWLVSSYPENFNNDFQSQSPLQEIFALEVTA